MNEVITINLNGRAYQLEKQGYAKLKDYLDEAARHLEADPDKNEIVADLEQAIAEKFDRLLNAGKTVVVEKEIEQVIEEMGKVEGQSEEKKEEKTEEQKSEIKVKHLYRLQEGKVIAGVCTGLAAYFDVDVVLVRLIFVVLTFVTGGAWILAYIIMMIILPKAETSAEMAMAFGAPFTAQDFVDRARESYVDVANKTKSEWKRWKYEMKQKKRAERWKQKNLKAQGCGGVNNVYYDRRPCGCFGTLIFWAVVLFVLWRFVPASHQYFQAVRDWLVNLDLR